MYFWYIPNYMHPRSLPRWIITEILLNFFEHRSQNGPISVKWKHQFQLIFCILRLSQKHTDFDSSLETPCMYCQKSIFFNSLQFWTLDQNINSSSRIELFLFWPILSHGFTQPAGHTICTPLCVESPRSFPLEFTLKKPSLGWARKTCPNNLAPKPIDPTTWFLKWLALLHLLFSHILAGGRRGD